MNSVRRGAKQLATKRPVGRGLVTVLARGLTSLFPSLFFTSNKSFPLSFFIFAKILINCYIVVIIINLVIYGANPKANSKKTQCLGDCQRCFSRRFNWCFGDYLKNIGEWG